MNPDPTVTVSWDYLVEFTDDGTQPLRPEAEVVVLPPASADAEPAPAPPNTPKA